MIGSRGFRQGMFAALAFLVAGQASASSQSGYIGYVAFNNGRMLFGIGTKSGAPSCDCCNRWEIDGSTSTGQSQLSQVLTAYSLHRSVNISGTGTCVSGANDTEGINYFQSN